MKGRRWRRYPPWIIVGVLLVAALLMVDWRRMWQVLRSGDPWMLSLAASINVLGTLVHAARWTALVRPLGRVSVWDCFTAMAVSHAGGMVLPARLGELGRIRLICRAGHMAPATAVGAILLDYLVNMLSLLPLLLVLPLLPGLPGWLWRSVLVVVVVLVVGVSLAFVWAAEVPESEGGRWWLRRLRQLRVGLRAVRRPSAVGLGAGWGVLGWLCEAGVLGASLAAFGIGPLPATVLLVLVAVNVAVALPAAPANLGTLELAVVLSLGTLGVPREQALAAGIGYHLVQWVVVWLVALMAWPHARRLESRPNLGR